VIARIWRGRTRAEDLAEYRSYVERTGLVDYRQTEGNRGAFILTRQDGDIGEIVTLSFWESLEAIRAFAGDDVAKARYYPQDERYLLDFPATVDHYEVIG
jgi:heme-degrading monooxygenase HmoA